MQQPKLLNIIIIKYKIKYDNKIMNLDIFGR